MDPGEYLKRWSLRDARNLADTPTCAVFTVESEGAPAVLKLFKPQGLKDEGKSALALSYFDGLGSVRLLKADTHAQLLNYADGPFLSELSASGRDREASLIASHVISRLHSPRKTPVPRLKTLSDVFSNFISWARLEDGHLWKKSAGIARELLLSEKEKVVLHGDLHHKNILATTGGDWLAIDPKAYFGERTFDLANLFYNPDDQPQLPESEARIEEMAGLFARELNLDRSRILKFAFAFGGLSAFWAAEDGFDPSRRMRIAARIGQML